MNYIFVWDQGRVFGTSDAPTAGDLDYAAVGMLTIVDVNEGRYFGREGRWLPVPRGVLRAGEHRVDDKGAG